MNPILQFFKPTTQKLAFFVLFFLILPVPFYQICVTAGKMTMPCLAGQSCPAISCTGWFWTQPLGGLAVMIAILTGNSNFSSDTQFPVTLAFLLVAAYLLACVASAATDMAIARLKKK